MRNKGEAQSAEGVWEGFSPVHRWKENRNQHFELIQCNVYHSYQHAGVLGSDVLG